MLSHTDGNLYASTVSKNKNSAIFKLNTKTINWEHIGGNGINGSWINSGFNYGFSMSSQRFPCYSKQSSFSSWKFFFYLGL